MPCLIVGTWTFSREAVRTACQGLVQGLSCTDAVERGINKIEEDQSYGACVVGVGGVRNSAGQLELDAAIMEGKSLRFGAVTALQGVCRPVSVARTVMDKCPHNMLTGNGAMLFAKEQGFSIEECLLSPQTDHDQESVPSRGHDTLGLIALDGRGNVSAGVSTSGAGNKHPGRVGDSALPGNGLYADADSGAACCSGDGDQIMMFCPSFRVVQLMREGKTPQSACDEVIGDIRRRWDGQMFEVSVIAANMKNEYGASSTVENWRDPLTGEGYPGFPYVVWTDGMSEPEIRISNISVGVP